MPSAKQHLLIGLAIRLILTIILPYLLDDGLLLQGVRYTDIDYDVFTDAAHHVAHGNSPYERHTYRYTPFLAGLLALPYKFKYEMANAPILSLMLSTKYFGKILFCVADALCGYIIVLLRRRQRAKHQSYMPSPQMLGLSADFTDTLWWLYNPLPINISTRGSAESLVVLLPVLATVAVAEMQSINPQQHQSNKVLISQWSIILRSCLAGILHGIGIHAKLYPLIYSVSFMAYFSHQQQLTSQITIFKLSQTKSGWKNLLSEQMQYLGNCFCCGPSKSDGNTFPWRHPVRIFVLAMLWLERLFLTLSSL
jgi:phosphatidylinositol glycan class M